MPEDKAAASKREAEYSERQKVWHCLDPGYTIHASSTAPIHLACDLLTNLLRPPDAQCRRLPTTS